MSAVSSISDTRGDGTFVSRWSQVRRWTPRLGARHAILSGLSVVDALTGRIDRAFDRPRIHFLYLHHIFPDETASFRTLLTELARRHRFISHGEAIERLRRGEIDHPYISFSFDDGLKSCLDAGRILAEFDASACFFICPPMAEEKRFERIASFCRDRLEMPPTEFLDWDDMAELASLGHEIGSHTMTHRLLSTLTDADIRYELEESRNILIGRFGRADHFAWPFGRFFHVDRRAIDAAFAAGYSSCVSAERGAHVVRAVGSPRSMCIRRDQLIAAWPKSHMRYFISRSSEAASAESNNWPGALAPIESHGAAQE